MNPWEVEEVAAQLFLEPINKEQRKNNKKMFKKEITIACPLCQKDTVHEHENKEHWIACKTCKEVFEVSESGYVWKFCQRCSQWEYKCDCYPEDDC